jgi:hypothetical protein
MRGGYRFFLPTSLLLSLLVSAVSAKTPVSSWFTVSRASLCVTEGEINETNEHHLAVNAPKMRAYVNRWTGQSIEAHFTYLGPTARMEALASGQVRRQFGLKLRAQDACNLVYAMWRVEPESKFVVSVKTNPGQHTSAECGNRGYQNIRPQKSSPLPLLHPGETHTLRAEMNAAELAVWADNVVVWRGNVGARATGLAGPVGIRSDNAQLEFELRALQSPTVHPDYTLTCRSDGGD